MAIIKYPDWLPLAQRASKNLTQQTPFRSDQPAVGAPIFQKLTTDIAATWSLTWKFTLAEERAFIQWLRSPSYLNKCNNWFTMMIDLGGSGLQEQTLHFTDYPVQTSIDGGVVTWTGNVIAKKLNNTMDELDDVLVELDYRWYSWLDEVVNRELPQVYMAPILHMPINMLSSTLDSRIIYNGPQVYYINRNGNLVQSAANEWPLTFIDGVAVGRVPPENASVNLYSESNTPTAWPYKTAQASVTAVTDGSTNAVTGFVTVVAANRQDVEFLAYEKQMAPGDKVTFSGRVGGDYGRIRLRVAKSGVYSDSCDLKLDNGTETHTSNFTANAVRESDGYIRFNATFTSPSEDVYLLQVRCRFATGGDDIIPVGTVFKAQMMQLEVGSINTSYIATPTTPANRTAAKAKVAMNGATSIDITYSDDSVVNVPAVEGYATIPQADSAWGSKYITTIKFNV